MAPSFRGIRGHSERDAEEQEAAVTGIRKPGAHAVSPEHTVKRAVWKQQGSNLSNGSTNWRLNVQIEEPVGDSSHSNH